MISFAPAVWARNRHFQTILSPCTRRFWKLPQDEILLIPNQQEIPLLGKLWKQVKGDSIVIVYHGLAGCETAPYVTGVSLALFRTGFSVLRMRLRGAEIEHPWTPYLYHAGLTEDISPVLKKVREMGYQRIYLVGFSLSANTILKWLGEGEREVEKALVVSPPVRLTSCQALIDHPQNWFYRNYFLRKLKRTIEQKKKYFPERFSSYVQPNSYATIYDFDNTITAPIHGFRGAEHYYEMASSFATLGKIRNKVRVIHSEDDPFLDSSDLREMKGQADHNLEICLLNRGGHVGFFEGLKSGYAVDRWATEYFHA